MTERCTTLDCLTAERKSLGIEHAEGEHKDAAVAGRELQLSIQQYEKLFQFLPNGLILVNRKGKIVHINGQMENLFGYKKEELLGKNLEILMPERFRARHRKHVADYIANPRIRPMGSGLELFGLKRDGTEFPIDISLGYLTTDDLLAMAIVRDVTEQKNNERKIELSLQIQRAISSVLKISLEPVSLEEQISRVLDLIVTIPSFALHARGSVYLADDASGMLVLKAMHGFSVAQVASCQTVPLGKTVRRPGSRLSDHKCRMS